MRTTQWICRIHTIRLYTIARCILCVGCAKIVGISAVQHTLFVPYDYNGCECLRELQAAKTSREIVSEKWKWEKTHVDEHIYTPKWERHIHTKPVYVWHTLSEYNTEDTQPQPYYMCVSHTECVVQRIVDAHYRSAQHSHSSSENQQPNETNDNGGFAACMNFQLGIDIRWRWVDSIVSRRLWHNQETVRFRFDILTCVRIKHLHTVTQPHTPLTHSSFSFAHYENNNNDVDDDNNSSSSHSSSGSKL